MTTSHEEDTATFAPETSSRAAIHRGGCHCGAVRFEVEIDPAQAASRCNCSICTKVAPTGGMVKPAAFELLSGEDSLSFYEWGAKMSRRAFCSKCGVHCFGAGSLAELGGDFVSVNLNTLDDVDPALLNPKYWDGRHDNWHAGPRATPWPV
jgi:hypothetical protein